MNTDTLRENLVSGSSYLTENSDNPERDGAILADNIEAVTVALFGEEYEHEDREHVIALVSGGSIDAAYNENMDVEQAIADLAKGRID